MAVSMTDSIHLLFPPGMQEPVERLSDQELNELECMPIIYAIAGERKHDRRVKSIVQQFSHDPNVIAYRLDILEDFIDHPELLHHVEKGNVIIDEMRFATSKSHSHDHELLQTVSRLRELSIYVDFITQMEKAFAGRELLKSAGLRQLRDRIVQVSESADFKNLATQLPKLQKGLDSLSSVTIGINLDAQLNPVQATLLSINDERYTGASLFGKLFAGGNEYQGISELHKDPDVVESIVHNTEKMHISIASEEEATLRRVLFRDLRKLLKNMLKPVHPIIEQYLHLRCQWILSLEAEFAFYIGAVAFIERMRSLGLPMCRPTLLPMEQQECRMYDNYNVNLALRMSGQSQSADYKLNDRIVSNDVCFDDEGRIFILTGPNSGGKTTYAQAIGLTQILLQCGLYVPCSRAEISPVDALHVYFNVEEQAALETGRLGVESKRISEIFHAATPNSMVLLNESFSSTSPGESYYLMKDIVSALRLLGLRAVVATHLHDLADRVDSINSEVEGSSKLISMVAGIREGTEHDSILSNRSYKVQPGRPQGRSFAMDIARQYGISFDQLSKTIRERNTDLLAEYDK
ncbi:MutS-related protein [Paenibacillus paeoniae]|uniref:MutS-related protein n=1 Tax=Paenibacillus paeoniae TaxID=2292705 RepID=UPI001401C6BE|nr:hypothetical protein [Paenibacillus paeoniae]